MPGIKPRAAGWMLPLCHAAPSHVSVICINSVYYFSWLIIIKPFQIKNYVSFEQTKLNSTNLRRKVHFWRLRESFKVKVYFDWSCTVSVIVRAKLIDILNGRKDCRPWWEFTHAWNEHWKWPRSLSSCAAANWVQSVENRPWYGPNTIPLKTMIVENVSLATCRKLLATKSKATGYYGHSNWHGAALKLLYQWGLILNPIMLISYTFNANHCVCVDLELVSPAFLPIMATFDILIMVKLLVDKSLRDK